jgi:sodium/bile acid cotransporter 7
MLCWLVFRCKSAHNFSISQVGNIRAVQAVNNSLVFLVNGLTLQSDDLKKALKNWTGVVYGILSILVITPCAGFLTQQLSFRPREFTEGIYTAPLLIFCVRV